MASTYWLDSSRPWLVAVLVICLVQVSLSTTVAATADDSDATEQDEEGATDSGLPSSSLVLELVATESRVNSITVRWNITDVDEVREYVVVHNKVGSQSTTYSGPQYNSSQTFHLDDLVANTKYNVCISLVLGEGQTSCPSDDGSCHHCVRMSTIPVIRDDSLIAVILTLGTILLLVLIGFLCWHYAKKRKEEEDGTDDDEEDQESLIVAGDDSKQPILLSVPPTSNGPRRSVDFEDQDIPYITPPIEETRKEQNDKRRDFFLSA